MKLTGNSGVTFSTIAAVSAKPPANQARHELPVMLKRNPSSTRYSFKTSTCPRCRQFNTGSTARTSAAQPIQRGKSAASGS